MHSLLFHRLNDDPDSTTPPHALFARVRSAETAGRASKLELNIHTK